MRRKVHCAVVEIAYGSDVTYTDWVHAAEVERPITSHADNFQLQWRRPDVIKRRAWIDARVICHVKQTSFWTLRFYILSIYPRCVLIRSHSIHTHPSLVACCFCLAAECVDTTRRRRHQRLERTRVTSTVGQLFFPWVWTPVNMTAKMLLFWVNYKNIHNSNIRFVKIMT